MNDKCVLLLRYSMCSIVPFAMGVSVEQPYNLRQCTSDAEASPARATYLCIVVALAG